MNRVSVFLVLLLLPVAAGAQPAPTPPDPNAPPPPPPRREGSAELAFVSTTGNADTQTLGLAGELILRPDRWLVRTKMAFIRNEAEDVTTAESFLYLFRLEHALTPRLSAFGQYEFFRDEFAGIEQRHDLTGGLAYKLVEVAPHLLIVDAGIGYSNEQRVLGDDLSTAIWTTGLFYKLAISETASFVDEFRLKQSFEDAGDWRISQTATVSAKLTSLFSLNLSNTIRYANEPALGFDETDTTTAVALVAKF